MTRELQSPKTNKKLQSTYISDPCSSIDRNTTHPSSCPGAANGVLAQPSILEAALYESTMMKPRSKMPRQAQVLFLFS